MQDILSALTDASTPKLPDLPADPATLPDGTEFVLVVVESCGRLELWDVTATEPELVAEAHIS